MTISYKVTLSSEQIQDYSLSEIFFEALSDHNFRHAAMKAIGLLPSLDSFKIQIELVENEQDS